MVKLNNVNAFDSFLKNVFVLGCPIDEKHCLQNLSNRRSAFDMDRIAKEEM